MSGRRVHKSNAAVIAAENFSKTFSGRTVLNSVHLEVQPGEIRALVGQNGSGKSTLIKILSGYHAPDRGARLKVLGNPVHLPLAPNDARGLGLSFVHQDLGLAEDMSVLENLRVGRYETGFGWRISWSRERSAVAESLRGFDLHFGPDTQVSSLRDVERAMVAILRALEQTRAAGKGLLVLDEPTAYLPRDGVDRLFSAIRRVADAGMGVLFVTHRLDEVRAISDRVTVLRDGCVVEDAPTGSLTERDVIQRILGRALGELYPDPHDRQESVAFSIRDLTGGALTDFSLDVHRGEIVGLTGLLGMGQDHVLYLLFGAEEASGGSLNLDGASYMAADWSTRQALASGLALLPGNRLRHGAAPEATVTENLTLARLPEYYTAGLLRRRRERADLLRLLDGFRVDPPDPSRVFATLSGGNQQKALLAKWFSLKPKVLLLHEPTQGVDVGARRQIFRHIRDAAQGGISVILASTEYEDLANLCDRVIVFRDGRAISKLQGSGLTNDRIVEQCFTDEGGTAEGPMPAMRSGHGG